MSIEVHMAQQQVRDMEQMVHAFCSLAGNALERISILNDEGEADEVKREVAALREALSRIRRN